MSTSTAPGTIIVMINGSSAVGPGFTVGQTGKGDQPVFIGYWRDNAAKKKRCLIPFWVWDERIVVRLVDYVRIGCRGENNEYAQGLYDRLFVRKFGLTPQSLDFSEGGLRRNGENVLCSNCACECKPTLRCGPCWRQGGDYIFYCSKECQKTAWPTHKHDCGLMEETAKTNAA